MAQGRELFLQAIHDLIVWRRNLVSIIHYYSIMLSNKLRVSFLPMYGSKHNIFKFKAHRRNTYFTYFIMTLLLVNDMMNNFERLANMIMQFATFVIHFHFLYRLFGSIIFCIKAMYIIVGKFSFDKDSELELLTQTTFKMLLVLLIRIYNVK